MYRRPRKIYGKVGCLRLVRKRFLFLLVGFASVRIGAVDVFSVGDFLQSIAEESRIPGAGLVVVRQDVVAITTIGLANDTGQSFDTETLFPLGDISGAFTAAAVSVSDLSIDQDIKESIPWLGISTTLRDLLTHTSGFDDRTVGYVSTKIKEETLEEWLRSAVPHRSEESAHYPRRSRWGIALAGHIAAQSQGSSFENVVKNMVFDPLNMASSTFVFPDTFIRAMPCPSTQCRPVPALFRRDTPSGGMYTTLSDMGRFLKLMTTPTTDSSKTIAKALTAAAWSSDEMSQNMSLGMPVQMIGGSMGVALSGGTIGGYRSLLVIAPKERAALFLIATGGHEGVGQKVLEQFEVTLGHVDQDTLEKKIPVTQEYSGVYLESGAPRAGIGLFPGLFTYSNPLAIDSEDWLLRVEGARVSQYGKVEGERFRQKEGPGFIKFVRNVDGKIVSMHADSVAFGARFPTSYDKVSSFRNPQLISDYLPLLVLIPIVVFLAWLFVISGAQSGQWRASKALKARNKRSYLTRWAFSTACFVLVLQALFVFHYLQKMQELGYLYVETLASGISVTMYRAAWLALLIAMGTLVLCTSSVAIWRDRETRWVDRVMLVSTSLFGLMFVLFLVWFDLLVIPQSTYLH